MNEMREKIRLILVDDELEFLTSTAKALNRRGFVVRTVQNGTIALKLLEDEVFDVAVLDVKMPGISGDDLFREIKRRWPSMPVIMLTGHGTVEQAFQTSREGVYEYLTKPCDLEKLTQVAKKAVGVYKQAASIESEPGEDEEIRLLIVDDEQELLASLSTALGRRGMRVATASGGAEALDRIRKQTFDVILLDVKMPEIDGVTMLYLVKQTIPLCEVILFTGHPSVEVAVEGVRNGAFDYMVKPQDPDALAVKIRAAFRRSRSRAAEAERENIDQVLKKRLD